MASTITLQSTINAVLPYVQYRPLAVGTPNEPAITIANVVKQTILGPPFAWRWNRNTIPQFATASNISDYGKAVPDFGFLEKATVDGKECELQLNLGTETGAGPGRPSFCSAYIDDNAGNITFRLQSIPDSIYQVNLTYQKKPTLFAALTDTWAPIPDEYSYTYQFGFLSLAMAYSDDMRFPQFSQMFKGHLLGIAEGLKEKQIAVFMDRWDRVTDNTRGAALRTQQGVQSLGV
jgi:hypothetical protein